jgi:lipopolysaccharide transport system permease protein
MQAIATVYTHRWILWSTTRSDVRARFTGTVLGAAWTFLYPVLFLGLYAVVYTMIYQIRVTGHDTVDYVILIFCGLVPFLGFAEALGSGVTAVTANRGLVKNTTFPIELVPVKAVLASSVTMIIGMAILMAVLTWRGIVHLMWLIIPLIVVLQTMFTVGLIWLLSALNVFVSDLGHTVGILILFLMLISPIAYTHEMIPPELVPFMYPNPLYYLIMLYRDAAFSGVVRVDLLLMFTVIAVVTLFLGAFVFSRLKTMFADYV